MPWEKSMTDLYEGLITKKVKLAVVGLGYVGMPIAVSFSEKVNVIGFDVNAKKIQLYQKGIDPTKEVGDKEIERCNVEFTCDESRLQDAVFFIVAVPTPVNMDHTPALLPLQRASETVGKHLHKGAVVVYESTVYPGVTEDVCVPLLEKKSGLICGRDFKVGYSPERINPGDKVHCLKNITKVVSGIDEEALNIIAKVYEMVIEAGVYRAETIKVAEAAKVIENVQRDINIAFMNELSIMFHKMGIDTKSVLEAAATKWNFLRFTPGLVGGHCIGVDPYYLTYKAESLGYHSQIILSGRRINDDMGRYVAENTVKCLIKADIHVKEAKILIMGITFKENCPDVRNTKVIDIINELRSYGVEPIVSDPEADPEEVKKVYGIELCDYQKISGLDVIILAVGHKVFLELSDTEIFDKFVSKELNKRVIIDVKGILNKDSVEKKCLYWRL